MLDPSGLIPEETAAPTASAIPADLASVTGFISRIRRLAIHDGPGIRSVVFLKGCPLHCAWCAAPETQGDQADLEHFPERCLLCDECLRVCPEGAIRVERGGRRRIDRHTCTLCGRCVEVCYADALRLVGARRTVAEVLAEVERDRVFYTRSGGGVTLSGGEPLQQPDFTRALLRVCRLSGLHTAMETSGYADWEILRSVLPELDLLLYDVKHTDAQKHEALTGVTNEGILENLRQAVHAGIATIVRVPVIPGLNDAADNFRALARFLHEVGSIRQIDLLPYHRLGEATYARLGKEYTLALPLPSEEHMQSLAELLRSEGFVVTLGG
jgi:pyruvate formate lyase activating enzyme